MTNFTAMFEAAPLSLANICLDLQIGICMFLHPSDILALRKVCQHLELFLNKWHHWSIIKICKALELSTRQRVVWVAALHRVCIDNTLFLPSFPISDMSDSELEKTAMAPRRWIELCRRLEKQDINDLRPRATRFFDESIGPQLQTCQSFIVPGGRYLVRNSPRSISVLDLGYTSSADCKLIASVVLDVAVYGWNLLAVQATPDGKGLIVILSKL
jgi:hypothetical protein